MTTFVPVLFCHEKAEFEHNPDDPFDQADPEFIVNM
jgi:hypothetical protein